MPFCEDCQHYFSPPDTACPACGAPALPPPTPTPQWTAALPGAPDALAWVGGALWIATHTAEQAALTRLDPTGGAALELGRWGRALITGLVPWATGAGLALTDGDLLRGASALLALDAAGAVQWRWPAGRREVGPPAVVGAGLSSVVGATTLVSRAPADGALLSEIPLPAPAARAAPVACGPQVLLAGSGPYLLALTAERVARWELSPALGAPAPPLVLGERIYVAGSAGRLSALRVADGSLLWEQPVGPAGKPLSAPATDGERLFVGARDGLHALAADAGRALWHFPTARRIAATPVVHAGVVYAAGHDHTLYALAAASGRALWRYQAGARLELAPLLGPGSALALADSTGTATWLTRPASASELEAAGAWIAAAGAYADAGEPTRGAALLAAHGAPRRAAPLWEAAGELRNAADQYERAGAWDRAESLWRAAGMLERAEACAAPIARAQGQPYLDVAVAIPANLRLGESRAFTLIVRNVGGGPAMQLCLHRTPSAVQGDCASQQLQSLRAGQQCTQVLYLIPERAGELPLDLTLTYTDPAGQPCERRYRAVLQVQPAAPAQQVVLSGDFHGPVAVGSGNAIDLRGAAGPEPPPTGALSPSAALRPRLQRLDDVALETLCLDHFPAVYATFSRGLRRDEKLNLLLDYCTRNPAAALRLAELLDKESDPL